MKYYKGKIKTLLMNLKVIEINT